MRWLPFSRKHDATRRPKAARRCSPPLFLSNTQLPSAALLLMATPQSTDDPGSSVSIHPVVVRRVLTRSQSAKEQLEGEPASSQSVGGKIPQNVVTNHSYDQKHPSGAPSATANGAAGAPSERLATEVATGPSQASAVLAPPHAPTPSQSSQPTTSRSGTAENKDPEKDKGSLDTTLNTRTHSIRRKDAKSASEGTHTMSTEQPGSPQTKSKRARQSLFVKLFHVLVPCVGPSQRTRLQDELYAPGQQPKATASTSALKEKQVAKEAEELPPPPPTSGEPTPGPAPEQQPVQSSQPEVFTAQESTPTLKPLTIPIQAEQQEQEQEIIIPPTPSRSLLPPEETEGMTSGAVQPPGSTGEESPHDHIHGQGRESGTESDGSTSFTEDEDLEDQGPLDDIEDEEERLIMNGGAGIPLGPVRSQGSVFSNCSD